MTETIETSQPPSSIVSVIVPSLILVAIAVEFLAFHSYSLLLPESMALILSAAAVGLPLGALTRIRPEVLPPLVIGFVGALFVSRPALYELYDGQFGSLVSAVLGQENVSVVYYCFLLLAATSLCWLLRQHLSTIAALVFGVIILSSVVLPSNSNTQVSIVNGNARQSGQLPPMVHVILDGQISINGLTGGIPNQQAAKDALAQTYSDFEVFERGYSLFAQTKNSMASLMNGQFQLPGDDLIEERGETHRLLRNAWFNKLKRDGYNIHVYQSTWFDMCSDMDLIASCYTYPVHGINPIQRSSLSGRQRFVLLAHKILADKGFALFAFPQLTPLPATEAFQQFRKDLAGAKNGDAFIVHILLPHEGYLYGPDCTLLPPDKWGKLYIPGHRDAKWIKALRAKNYRHYLDQMACTNLRMKRLFQQLRRQGVYEETTIIIHGDHGSRITSRNPRDAFSKDISDGEIVDLYATHLAIKTPDGASGRQSASIAIQHVFADRFLRQPNPANKAPNDTVFYLNPDASIVERIIALPQ